MSAVAPACRVGARQRAFFRDDGKERDDANFLEEKREKEGGQRKVMMKWKREREKKREKEGRRGREEEELEPLNVYFR